MKNAVPLLKWHRQLQVCKYIFGHFSVSVVVNLISMQTTTRLVIKYNPIFKWVNFSSSPQRKRNRRLTLSYEVKVKRLSWLGRTAFYVSAIATEGSKTFNMLVRSSGQDPTFRRHVADGFSFQSVTFLTLYLLITPVVSSITFILLYVILFCRKLLETKKNSETIKEVLLYLWKLLH